MQRLILRLYGVLFCLFFAFIFTAQVLSFLGLFQALLVFPLSLAVWAGACWLYFRADNGWLAQTLPPDAGNQSTLRTVILIAGVVLLVSVFLLRMVMFPYSSIGSNVASDALSYHFVRAIELVRTGTMWDLSILYGEYPPGYESLISLSLMLSGTVFLIGAIQALGLVLLVLTLCLLLRRYTRLPLEVTLFISVMLFFYPDLYSYALLIGKNDLLLATLILAAILHSPLAVRGRPDGVHVFGLAFATCMAMSVKPGGYLILGLLWLVVLFKWALAYRRGQARAYLPMPLFIGAVVAMIPCGFWVLRNYAIMGRMVSPEVSSFFSGSILASLGDPMLYNSGTESVTLIVLSAWLWLLAGMLLITRRFTLPVVLLLPVMWLAFIATPLSAFHTVERTALHVEWRYTTHAFLMMAVLVIAMLETRLMLLYRWANRYSRLMSAAVAAGSAAIIIVLNPASLLAYHPENAQHLQDPYPEAVGVDGYYSIYDYVRREIHNSTLIANGATVYYLYTLPYDNLIRDVQPQPLGMPNLLPRPTPDYFLYIRPAWQKPDAYPDEAALMPPYHWTPLYEDATGILYQRAD